MAEIGWCMGQKDGISMVEPNSNLPEAFMKKAEDALDTMRVSTAKDWKISAAYYAMYFSLYAILMRLGVKCEIHSCTLEFARHFLGKYLSKDELDFLKASLRARIDAQYYVNRDVPDKQFQEMVIKAPEFLVKCRSVLLKLNEKNINEIRNGLRERLDLVKRNSD